MMEMALLLPEADFHLYGQARDEQGLRLMKSSPSNVHFHDPIFGRDKTAVLVQATMYLQPSRWEAFSVSASEAMAVGVPCAMSENLHLTRILTGEKAVLPISPDPKIAAGQIGAALFDAERLRKLSERGRSFIRTNCSPLSIARQYVSHYREVLQN
jgi:glycosyltransferase involved in cell wall biosynthesis